jgi:nickel/cobalt transporter (NicO) family protein
MRRLVAVAALVGGLTAGMLSLAPPASAHPLGNVTVNHYDGLLLTPDGVTDSAVEDVAEIPTLQRRSRIDRDGDGALSEAERTGYAASQCDAMAAAQRIAVDGRVLTLTVAARSYVERPGAAGLLTGRLECRLTADVDLRAVRRVDVDAGWDGQGIGWHEITARGQGVTLSGSVFPADSTSDELRAYPNDLLSSPLDVRRGSMELTPGGGSSTYAAVRDLPGAGLYSRTLGRVSTTFDGLVGREHLTVGVGLLAFLLALLLGAGHAFLPGHGKTIMAAYLVGRQGRLRDVVAVGATVTVTHTAGVLVLGLLVTTTAAFAPTAAEQLLAVVSGLLVAGVGLGLLVGALRRARRGRSAPAVPATMTATSALVGAGIAGSPAAAGSAQLPVRPAEHGHGHDGHGHDDHHDHVHEDHGDHGSVPEAGAHGHTHGPGGHSHGPGGHSHGSGGRYGRGGLLGLGVAGGLVPSPSALLVLLAAAALGRTIFGVLLVLAYGLGMAAALTCAGLLLVRLRDRITTSRLLSGRSGAYARLAAAMPVLTAVLVLVVGLGLAARAAGGAL